MRPDAAGEAWWPDRLYRIMTGYQAGAMLKAAIELDLFGALAGGPADAAALAKGCQASERGLRILCDGLAVLGLLVKNGTVYAAAPGVLPFLDRNSDAYVGDGTLFLMAPEMVSRWDELAAIVRHGGCLDDGTISRENPIWVRFARGMGRMRRPQARRLARAVVADGAPRRVLEIAAGHAIFGIELARAAPEAEVTALDWPEVLKVAREHAEAAGVAERFRLLPGDALECELGTGYDLVLITNFLHHFDQVTATRVLARAADCLCAGGRAVVVDYIPDPDRLSPPVAALCAINMLVETPAGDAYTFSEIETMMRAAGFAGLTRIELPPTPHRAVSGRIGPPRAG